MNVLPLTFERNAADTGWNIEWSSSATHLFYRHLVSDLERYQPLFVGCPEVFISRDEEATVEKQLRALHCFPVFLNPDVAHRYYQGFCKGVLWPVFHNVIDVYNSAQLTLDGMMDNCPQEKRHPEATEEAHGSMAATPSKTPCPRSSWCNPASWNPAAQDNCWGDYCSVNRTFAKRVVETYHTGDVIWIHDFHFLMLPSYLLRKLRGAMIAMYLHVPFPSSEIFRCLSMRTEILRAMLCADHIGFLVFEHARHFLTSCKRLLGLNYKTSQNGMLVLEYNGRKINISCSHIEPDVRYLHTIFDLAERNDGTKLFQKKVESFMYDSKKQRKFVIAAVDRLEGLTALPLKLRAFDRFLALHPEKRGSVVLIQIGLSLDSRPNDYHQTRDYVQRFVAEINRRWAPPGEVVVYFEEKAKTTCAERMHLWRISDAFLDTCIRGGLSLLPFEFLVAQKRNLEQGHEGLPDHQFGVMIVSEFASYNRILSGCLSVNPWKGDDIVAALVKATEMQYYEKFNRFQLNYKFLESQSDKRWAERLLADFELLVQKKQQTAESGEIVEVGFGFDFRVMQFASGFVKLDVDELVRTSTRCSRRLFMFDYGGTLSWTTSLFEEEAAAHLFQQRRASSDDRSANRMRSDVESQKVAFGQEVIRFIDGQVRTPLSPEARESLRTLCDDPSNVVFVFSTGRKAEVEAEFGDIPNVNLVSDNGFFFKKAMGEWECLYNPHELKMDWREEVKRIMQSYATRTNGAYLLVSEASILYDYRRSDPEYGEIQALELYEQLRHVIKKGEATVSRAKGFIEVHQFGVNKAVAVSLILSLLRDSIGTPNFAMFVGDDDSDELAFKALQAFAEKDRELEHVFTCTVGMKPSSARFYVDSVVDVLAMLHAIAVRIRLENQRGRILISRGYFHHFAAQPQLVNPAFVQGLAMELSASRGLPHQAALADDEEGVSQEVGSRNEASVIQLRSETTIWQRLVGIDWMALGVGVAGGVILALELRRRLQRGGAAVRT
ncbi:hypothetical protein PINS_up002098 [Pythium insidiosum]|nr:hypothetical protein PINS_up002098 [Pythium insidiosum]